MASIPPGFASFVDLLGPPVEQRRGADARVLPEESGAAGKLRILQILDRDEVVVRQDGVGQRPQMFGRLQLGGIGRPAFACWAKAANSTSNRAMLTVEAK